MRFINRLILLISFVSGFIGGHASGPGFWLMNTGTVHMGGDISLLTDLQWRGRGTINNTSETVIRLGLVLSMKKLSVTMGVARLDEFSDSSTEIIKPAIYWENRAWEQFAFEFNIKRFYFENRSRAEQRFFSDARYGNRFRQLVRFSVPLNNKKIISNTFFISLYDEVFIDVVPTTFDRNRFYLAGGYKFFPGLSLQTGYLFESIAGAGTNGYFQLLLSYSLDPAKRFSPFVSE